MITFSKQFQIDVYEQATVLNRFSTNLNSKVKNLLNTIKERFWDLDGFTQREVWSLQERISDLPEGKWLKYLFIKNAFPFSKLPLELRQHIVSFVKLSYDKLEVLDKSCFEISICEGLNKGDFLACDYFQYHVNRKDFLERRGCTLTKIKGAGIRYWELEWLPNLRSLDYFVAQELSFPKFLAWNSFKQLTSLCLEAPDPYFKDSTLDHLIEFGMFNHLSFFNVTGDKRSVNLLLKIAQLPNITSMDFSALSIDVQLSDIFSKLPLSLKHLNFSHNPIGTVNPNMSFHMLTEKIFPHLIELNMTSTPLWDLIVTEHGLDVWHVAQVRIAFPSLQDDRLGPLPVSSNS